MDKREVVLSLLDKNKEQEYVPAGFFIHFDEEYHQGQVAIDKHMEYYRYTGMDFVKIQYENSFPHIPDIKEAADWESIPLLKRDFYENQLNVVEGLVKEAKNEALVIITLYSPFMMTQFITKSLKLMMQHM